jgi:uncharacterized protein YukE
VSKISDKETYKPGDFWHDPGDLITSDDFRTNGAGIVNTIDVLQDAVKANDDVTIGIAAAGLALDVLGLVLDPLGTIFAAGIGWLIEHVTPFRVPLDMLFGDPEGITVATSALDAEAEKVAERKSDLERKLAEFMQSWSGEGADAFRASTQELADGMDALQEALKSASKNMSICGAVVGAVRGIIRDLIAGVLGGILAGALAAIAAMAFTFGASIGIFLGTVYTTVVVALGKIAMHIKNLVSKITNAAKALKNVGNAARNLGNRAGDAVNGAPIPTPNVVGSGGPQVNPNTGTPPTFGNGGGGAGGSGGGAPSGSAGGHGTQTPSGAGNTTDVQGTGGNSRPGTSDSTSSPRPDTGGGSGTNSTPETNGPSGSPGGSAVGSPSTSRPPSSLGDFDAGSGVSGSAGGSPVETPSTSRPGTSSGDTGGGTGGGGTPQTQEPSGGPSTDNPSAGKGGGGRDPFEDYPELTENPWADSPAGGTGGGSTGGGAPETQGPNGGGGAGPAGGGGGRDPFEDYPELTENPWADSHGNLPDYGSSGGTSGGSISDRLGGGDRPGDAPSGNNGPDGADGSSGRGRDGESPDGGSDRGRGQDTDGGSGRDGDGRDAEGGGDPDRDPDGEGAQTDGRSDRDRDGEDADGASQNGDKDKSWFWDSKEKTRDLFMEGLRKYSDEHPGSITPEQIREYEFKVDKLISAFESKYVFDAFAKSHPDVAHRVEDILRTMTDPTHSKLGLITKSSLDFFRFGAWQAMVNAGVFPDEWRGDNA